MLNKKGQGLSTTAIVLIVLGVLVLVILILGFTMGWKKIAPWLTTSDIQKTVDACSIACSTGSVYDYCAATRELTDEDKNEIATNCNVFSKMPKLVSYGIAACPTIDCPPLPNCAEVVDGITVESMGSARITVTIGLEKDSCSTDPATRDYDVSNLAGDTTATEPFCCIDAGQWDNMFN